MIVFDSDYEKILIRRIMTNKLIIKTDITDWQEEALRNELLPDSEESIYKALDNKNTSAEIARGVIVAREKGIAPTDVIRPVKLLMQAGGQMDILQLAHRRKNKVTTKSGNEYEIPAYVGAVAEKVDEDSEDENEKQEIDNSFVNSQSLEGLQRAIDYMEKIIPGYVWGRLLIIYENGGDVRNEADKLKETIDEMVNRIMV
ncbi:MAG: hypothetical protein WC554_13300 [Clostridia bacterium]